MTLADNSYSEFEPAVGMALQEYGQRISPAGYGFGVFRGFEETPDKSYSAKSEVDIYCGDLTVSKLVLIVFQPHDGTGNESLISLKDAMISYPMNGGAECLPRFKEGVHSEAHLTIGSKYTHEDEIIPFAGNLAVLGSGQNDRVDFMYRVGHGLWSFAAQMIPPRFEHHARITSSPKATLTVGYSEGMRNLQNLDGRFGDPHAIVNTWDYKTQVAGFVAVDSENIGLMSALGAQEPRINHPA